MTKMGTKTDRRRTRAFAVAMVITMNLASQVMLHHDDKDN